MHFRQIKNSPSKLYFSQKGAETKVPPLIRVPSSKPRIQIEQKPHEVSRVIMMDSSIIQSQFIAQDSESKDIQKDFSDKNEFMEMQEYSSTHKLQSSSISMSHEEEIEIQHIKTEESENQKSNSVKAMGALELYQYFVINSNNNQNNFLNKNSNELLFNVLSNPQRLRIYLKHLQNLQIEQKKQNSKVSQNIEILLCLLLKLATSQTEVSLSSTSSKNFNINFSTSEIQKEAAQNNSEIRNLRNEISEKDEQIHIIKTKYDEVIHNYAESISNLKSKSSSQEKQEQEILLDFRASKPLTFEGVQKNSQEGSIFNQG